jgi:glycosyltransferase involved in cell wall biosynthesis
MAIVMPELVEPLFVSDSEDAPCVTVITVCYNAAETIEQTIQSVAIQVGVSIEYIVIDGKSHDDTVDILLRNASFINEWVSEADQGIYDAMNKGLKRARGEWVIFLNADDYFASPNSLQMLVSDAGDYMVVAGKTIIRYEDCEVIFQPSRRFGVSLQLPFMHPSVIVRRKIFSHCGVFDTRYKIAADCDFFMRLIRAGYTTCYVDDVVSIMRDGGVSNRSFVEGRREYRQAYLNNFEDSLGAWVGYIISRVFHLKARLF